MLKSLIRVALTALVLPLFAVQHAAAAYPDKFVKLLVPFGAGGITDFVARAYAERLAKELGVSVVVENRPGAGGNIAAEALKDAAADGYTLMLTTMGVVAVNPHTYKSLRFDPLKDFTYVSTVADAPHAVVVDPALPVSDLGELIAMARQKPEGLSYGTAGYGSSPHQGLEMLQAATSTVFLHVPFKSGAESVRSVMAGRVSMTFEALPVVLPQGKAGKLKILAIAAAKRHPSAPDLKTTAELGFPGVRSSSLSGLIGPAGLPEAIVVRLNAATQNALMDPALKERLFSQGSDPIGSTSKEFLEQVKAEHRKWGKLMERAPKI